MRLQRTLALLLTLLMILGSALSLVSLPARAQEAAATSGEMPPMPRPRPADRTPAPTPADTPAAPTGEATQAISELVSTPQSVTLTASIVPDGPAVPDGLVWRIFDTTPDTSGELALVAKSDQGTAQVELPPGEYMVHVAYGRAQASEALSVVPGTNSLAMVLDAGALRLNSAVTGDIPIPPSLLKFDILSGPDETARQVVAEGLLPNDIITLNSGTYHVIAYFGTVNAVVKADLRVEPGQLTDATLYQHASQVSFKLVSEEGGEAIADVEWTVKTADGTTVFTDLGAFPATVLAEGDYLVLAKQGDKVFNREFQVQSGAAREVEVLTAVY